MVTNHHFDKYRKQLHTLRANLDARAPSLRAEACHGAAGEGAADLSNAPLHLGDVGGQEAEAVVNLGLAENEAILRQEIDDALLRLEEGKFGLCEECRRVISPERLDALPYSSLCIRCAERSQQHGRS